MPYIGRVRWQEKKKNTKNTKSGRTLNIPPKPQQQGDLGQLETVYDKRVV